MTVHKRYSKEQAALRLSKLYLLLLDGSTAIWYLLCLILQYIRRRERVNNYGIIFTPVAFESLLKTLTQRCIITI